MSKAKHRAQQNSRVTYCVQRGIVLPRHPDPQEIADALNELVGMDHKRYREIDRLINELNQGGKP